MIRAKLGPAAHGQDRGIQRASPHLVRKTKKPMTHSTTDHAFTDDALADHDAVALATFIRTGKLSAAEVTTATIARSQKVHPQINAVQLENFEQARQHAQRPRE